MPDEKSPASNQLVKVANATINGDVVLSKIREIRQNEAMSMRQKREIIQAEVTGLMKARKNEIEFRLKIQEMKIDADVKAAGRAIDIYRNRLITEMDDEFNKFMRKLGIKVLMNKLELTQTLGEKLTAFKRTLEGKKIDKRFREKILKQVDLVFDDFCEQLGSQASESAVPDEG